MELPPPIVIVKTLLVLAILLSLVSLAVLALLAHRIRRLEVPPDAGLIEVLQMVPLSLVVVLDLLDLSLDVLAAPISWFILGRLGLGALRGLTVLEALIPGTQLLPTMTAAWFIARYLAPKAPLTSTAKTILGTGRIIDPDSATRAPASLPPPEPGNAETYPPFE